MDKKKFKSNVLWLSIFLGCVLFSSNFIFFIFFISKNYPCIKRYHVMIISRYDDDIYPCGKVVINRLKKEVGTIEKEVGYFRDK